MQAPPDRQSAVHTGCVELKLARHERYTPLRKQHDSNAHMTALKHPYSLPWDIISSVQQAMHAAAYHAAPLCEGLTYRLATHCVTAVCVPAADSLLRRSERTLLAGSTSHSVTVVEAVAASRPQRAGVCR